MESRRRPASFTRSSACRSPTGCSSRYGPTAYDITAEVRTHDVEVGGRQAVAVQSLDVTDRAEAVKTLRATQERQRMVARVTKEALWEWHPLTGALARNEAFSHLFRGSMTDITVQQKQEE